MKKKKIVLISIANTNKYLLQILISICFFFINEYNVVNIISLNILIVLV